MEIIHLILGKANPQRMNGVNRVVHEMATNQVLQDYPVEVWGITANPAHDYPERNFPTRLFRAGRNPFRLDPELKRALHAKKGNIVVHLHGAFLPAFYSVSLLLHNEDIPFVITPHSTYNKVMMKKNALRKRLYFLLFERRLLNRAAAIHLLGKSEWEGLGAIYHNDRSLLIPYGFSRVKAASGAGSDGKKAVEFTIVYCGRMDIFTKGLDILVEGFSLFNRQHPETRLVLIGDGKGKADLQDHCRDLRLHTSVRFMGPLFGEEKIDVLQRSHVFAHPSRTDGLPATILEAAALGMPCVVTQATNMGGFIREFDAGYAMRNEEPAEFCKGLNVLYERIRQLGEGGLLRDNACRMIDTAFDWAAILQRFDSIYRQALDRSLRRPLPGKVSDPTITGKAQATA